MSEYRVVDYSFESLAGLPGEEPESLAYMVGLVDKPDHKISDPLPAKRILSYIFDVEEQAPDAISLEYKQFQFFSRYFSGGYYPQTPCMLTRSWSPVAALLERGVDPLILRRENKILAVATGIWEPKEADTAKDFSACSTAEELFWSILTQVSRRAKQRGNWVSIVAAPGWAYDSKIGSLPAWLPTEVEKADRVIWQRTPEG